MTAALPVLARSSAATALFLAVGCAAPVAVDLDGTDANRIVAALDARRIAAEKSPDPTTEGRFRVDVAQGDVTRAEGILTEEGLPPPRTAGVLDALGTGALVPSRTAEHARLIAGVAGELERSLRGIDGVLSARVHLAVPGPDPLGGDATPAPATASVLLRFRGARTPIPDADVQRLVAGAVPGLAPSNVAVVGLAAPDRAPSDVVRVGPVSTSRASAKKLRAAIAFVALLNVALVGCLVLLWLRVRKGRRRPSEATATPREAR